MCVGLAPDAPVGVIQGDGAEGVDPDELLQAGVIFGAHPPALQARVVVWGR